MGEVTLNAGSRFGPYEIVALLGSGGMGDVYRAHDPRLRRDVAIKLLQRRFATDSDHLARFTREAHALASLNDPHIAVVYDVTHIDGMPALVMELVEGQTLADRLANDAIPLGEALGIAHQIAAALEVAHDHGIIHRDLKPANVKVTTGGNVKLLDFGLARVFDSTVGVLAEDTDGTLTTPAVTHAGVLLGTAAYMAPEQARGEVVDKRADIWALGVVLFEMLTGQPAFPGRTMTDVLAAVVTAEPDWSALSDGTPEPLRRLLQRCLQKDRRHRMRDAGDARMQIEDVLTGLARKPDSAEASGGPTGGRRWVPVLIATAVTALAAVLLFVLSRQQRVLPHAVIRFTIDPPPAWSFDGHIGTRGLFNDFAISPDGTKIVFTARSEEDQRRTQLWLRSLDSVSAELLPGTDNAYKPFWSPDGNSIGFFTAFAAPKLKRIDLGSKAVRELCDAPAALGGAWNARGEIVFGLASGQVFRVPSGGGERLAVTITRDTDRHMVESPQFLPDGRQFLYFDFRERALFLASLDSAERRRLVASDGPGLLTSAGSLLFLRDGAFRAQSFDVRTGQVRGESEFYDAGLNTEGVQFLRLSTGAGGIVAAAGGGLAQSQLVWIDRSGSESGVVGPISDLRSFSLSPDEREVLVSVFNQHEKRGELWVYDTGRGDTPGVRIAENGTVIRTPVWSPQGDALAYVVLTEQGFEIRRQDRDGGRKGTILTSSKPVMLTDWAIGSKALVYTVNAEATNYDIWVQPFDSDGRATDARVFAASRDWEGGGRVSADGRYIAYVVAGQSIGVYVANFPDGAGKQAVSSGPASDPVWRPDGSELYFTRLTRGSELYVTAVTGPRPTVSESKQLFRLPSLPPTATARESAPYAVSKSGARFLVMKQVKPPRSTPIIVTTGVEASINQER